MAEELTSAGTEPSPRAAVGGFSGSAARIPAQTFATCGLSAGPRAGADSDVFQPPFSRCLDVAGDSALKVNLLINGYFK